MLYNNDVSKVNKLDQILFEKLGTNREFEDKDSFFEDFELEYLQHLIPPEKLDKLITDVETLGDAEGYVLRNQVNVNNLPFLHKGNLVFGMNKYLHWFRGYYYQISMTPDGQGTVASPYFRMLNPLKLVYEHAGYTAKKYKNVEEFILTISALSVGLSFYNSMKRMISADEGVAEFDRFLTENCKEHTTAKYNFNTKEVLDLFEESTFNFIPSEILTQNSILLRNPASNVNFCILSITDTDISTVTRVGGKFRVIKFSLPDWYIDTHGVYEEEFGENPYKNTPDVLENLVQFALAYTGVKIFSDDMFVVGSEIDRYYSIHANINCICNTSELVKFIAKSV